MHVSSNNSYNNQYYRQQLLNFAISIYLKVICKTDKIVAE